MIKINKLKINNSIYIGRHFRGSEDLEISRKRREWHHKLGRGTDLKKWRKTTHRAAC